MASSTTWRCTNTQLRCSLFRDSASVSSPSRHTSAAALETKVLLVTPSSLVLLPSLYCCFWLLCVWFSLQLPGSSLVGVRGVGSRECDVQGHVNPIDHFFDLISHGATPEIKEASAISWSTSWQERPTVSPRRCISQSLTVSRCVSLTQSVSYSLYCVSLTHSLTVSPSHCTCLNLCASLTAPQSPCLTHCTSYVRRTIPNSTSDSSAYPISKTAQTWHLLKRALYLWIIDPSKFRACLVPQLSITLVMGCSFFNAGLNKNNGETLANGIFMLVVSTFMVSRLCVDALVCHRVCLCDFFCLSACLRVYLAYWLSVCLCPSAYLSFYLSLSLCLSCALSTNSIRLADQHDEYDRCDPN